ncbi:hypothetical protein WICPIJ_001882 [Wickerhamomyces pijperi]|uniref:Secreted protein n=1 Tax=Wickerhamomyces pijperi TaxID=599730 RepID=A0A9P8QAS2_WICPI|nr:hypothetical protein WICPIJ_001882 [Wickerhamomyces pijperi]
MDGPAGAFGALGALVPLGALAPLGALPPLVGLELPLVDGALSLGASSAKVASKSKKVFCFKALDLTALVLVAAMKVSSALTTTSPSMASTFLPSL